MFDRGYIIEVKKKLIPTNLGTKVYRYLIEKYGMLVNEERTKKIEEKMDMIEEGKEDYQWTLQEFYKEITSIK